MPETMPQTSSATDATGSATASGTSTGGTSTSSAEAGGESMSPVVFDVGTPGPPDLGEDEEGPVIPESCSQASDGETTVGCVFYAVDLDQYNSSETDQYAVAISNVQLQGSAEVVVERKIAGVWTEVAGPEIVAPLELFVFELPDHHQQLRDPLIA